jgi:hypothetical protein
MSGFFLSLDEVLMLIQYGWIRWTPDDSQPLQPGYAGLPKSRGSHFEWYVKWGQATIITEA